MGLTERIEAWPEAMKAARMQVADLEAAYAVVDLELSQAKERLTAMFADDSDDGYRSSLRTDTAQATAQQAKREEARQRQAEAEERELMARDAVNRAKAAADVQVRQEADATGKRLTESAVRARVQVQPEVVAAEQKWREARTLVTTARLDVRASLWTQPSTLSALDEESEDDSEEIISEAQIALQNMIAESQQRRVDILRQLESARVEVAYQRTVGKALGMLTTLAAAEITARR